MSLPVGVDDKRSLYTTNLLLNMDERFINIRPIRIQQVASSLVHARCFQPLILGIILLAGILAGLETSGHLRGQYGSAFAALDTAILLAFVAEIVLRLASYGRQPWRFFRDGWNVFDFIIVLVCCFPFDSQFAAVFRLARGLRLLRLITAVPKLQLLVGALLKSLGAMGYVSLLLTLVFYIYAVAGVNLFGPVDAKHFGTLAAALLSLFRLITLDNWTDIFLSVNSAGEIAAALYFGTFIMLGTMIMLNLFIGIIMNSMSEMHAEIEERDRAKHLASTGGTSLEDDLRELERQLDDLQHKASMLRRRHARPTGLLQGTSARANNEVQACRAAL